MPPRYRAIWSRHTGWTLLWDGCPLEEGLSCRAAAEAAASDHADRMAQSDADEAAAIAAHDADPSEQKAAA